MINIINDPVPFIGLAFDKLFPKLVVDIQFVNDLEGAGRTTFPDDGGTPLIDISTKIPISALPEILAHELAHIARPNDEHNEEWKQVFDLIFDEALEMYSNHYKDYCK